MRQRLITAAVLIPPAFFSLYFGPPLSVVLGVVVYCVLQFEFSRFAIHVRPVYQNGYWLVSLLLPAAILTAGLAGLALGIITLGLVFLVALVCIVEREPDPVPFGPLLGAVAIGTLYLGGLGALVPYALREISPSLAIWTVVIIGFSDSAAYFGGSYFQGRKLAPRISPKKTISGLISGVLFAVVAGGGLGHWLFPNVSISLLLATVLLISLAGVFGDLAESLLKRVYQVKDSSALLPGHGGLLDRVDALLFAVPVVLCISYFSTQLG